MTTKRIAHEEFFNEFETLLRMRLTHFHNKNGGELRFLKNLIITPVDMDDSYYSELKDAKRTVCALNQYLEANFPVEVELVHVTVDEDMKIIYEFNMYLETKTDALEEIERIDFILKRDDYCAYMGDYIDVQLTAINEGVWLELAQQIVEEISFGTLCMT